MTSEKNALSLPKNKVHAFLMNGSEVMKSVES